MSRKIPSFGQLVAYMQDMDKSDTQYNIYRNLYGRKLADIEAEFLENSTLVYKRKNGVYLYHEILSITKSKTLDEKRQKEILRDLAYEYAQNRAPNNLIFGALHDDHEGHLHYHFCISSNAVGERKKTRLSKAQFDTFKKDMEQRVLTNYPELEQKAVINKQAGEKFSNKGAEVKRRTGKTPQRDALKQKLTDIFAQTYTKQDFFTAMSEAGLETYVRGKTIGVIDIAHSRKHRLKTLGLLDAFHTMSNRIQLDEASNKQQAQAEQHEQQAKSSKQSPHDSTKTQHDTASDTPKPTDSPQSSAVPEPKSNEQNKTEHTPSDAPSAIQAKRQAEIERLRSKQSKDQSNQQHKGTKP